MHERTQGGVENVDLRGYIRPIQPLILDPAYIRLKSDVTLAERRILKELGFCVHVKHPHKLIVIYMQQLGYGKEQKFMQMAWNYMNDALRTTVFVVHTPEAIACACIYLTGRMLNISLPATWFLVFDIQEEELIQISTQIVELYERPKINVDELEAKVHALTKAYQETRLKGRSGAGEAEPSAAKETKAETPNPAVVQTDAIQAQPLIASTKQNEELRKKSPTSGSETKFSKEVNGNMRTKSKQEASPKRRSRRSPSPIVYSESPSRHRHKKRKKNTSSRSRSRDRRASKKKRERSPEPGRHHHKRKYYHR